MTPQLEYALFLETAHGWSLRLSATAGPPGMIEARLSLWINSGPLVDSPLRRQAAPAMNLIPPLLAPDGAQQRALGGGGGGGGGDWRVSAEVTTDLDLAAVTAHYTAQLEGASWRASAQGVDDRVRWSVWEFTEKDGAPWRAYLLAFQRPDDPTRYFLDMHCQRVGSGSSGGGGGFSHSF